MTDAKISTESSSTKVIHLNSLISPSNIQERRYYKLEGDNAPSVLDLPNAANNLTECYSLSTVARFDVTLAANEIKNFEASVMWRSG